jgi:hypothetical protein
MSYGQCRRLAVLVGILLWMAVPTVAQRSVQRLEENRGYFVAPPQVIGVAQKAGPQKMAFDIVYDDGETDVGYGFANTASFYDLVQRFDLPASPLQVDALELCLFRTGPQDALDFDLTIWDDNGAGGGPGTLLEVVTAQVSGLPGGGLPTFFTFDLSGLDIVVEGQKVYIGAGWSPDIFEDFFLCGDYDRDTVQPGFDMVNLDLNWVPLQTADPQYTALMVRGSFSALDSSTCVSDTETLCLNNGRFQVKMDWRTPQGDSGQGMGVQLTADTGYFWFFQDTNVEVVIKVLDACVFADHFWVFAGGLTNVEVVITVTDTATGAVKVYTNPLTEACQPIQDTEAFLTCP